MPATFHLIARLALLAALALGWRFAMSPSPAPEDVFATGWDRLYHFYSFLVLGFCATALWPKQARHLMIFIGMYAVVVAFMQSSIPGGARDWELVLSNLIAGFVGWLGAEPFRRRQGL
jgi:VanZ family protein